MRQAAAGTAVCTSSCGLCKPRGATRQPPGTAPPTAAATCGASGGTWLAPAAPVKERALSHRPSCLEGRGSFESSPKWRHRASGCRPCNAAGSSPGAAAADGMLEEAAAVGRRLLRGFSTRQAASWGRAAVASGRRRRVEEEKAAIRGRATAARVSSMSPLGQADRYDQHWHVKAAEAGVGVLGWSAALAAGKGFVYAPASRNRICVVFPRVVVSLWYRKV